MAVPVGAALKAAKAALELLNSKDKKKTLAKILVAGMVGSAVPSLFGAEKAVQLAEKAGQKLAQQLGKKILGKYQDKIDQFKGKVKERVNDIKDEYKQKFQDKWDQIKSKGEEQAASGSAEVQSSDLQRYPNGIPPDELDIAKAELVNPEDAIDGKAPTDPLAEDPSQIEFKPQDADNTGKNGGDGNLAERPMEPATDVGNHASELPNPRVNGTTPEADAVKELCKSSCNAQAAKDPFLDVAAEEYNLGNCCSIRLSDPAVYSGEVIKGEPRDAVVNDIAGRKGGEGLPADIVGEAPIDVPPVELPPLEGVPKAAIRTVPGAPTTATTRSHATLMAPRTPRSPQRIALEAADAQAMAPCDTRCQLLVAMEEAVMIVLSDLDQTKHGPHNQEGVGQMLPHRQVAALQSCAHTPATTTVGNDMTAIGCELIHDLDATAPKANDVPDIRAAFAMYVKDNHLPPINAAWPGQSVPSPTCAPVLGQPECDSAFVDFLTKEVSDLAKKDPNPAPEVRPGAPPSRGKTVNMPTATLLTMVTEVFLQRNTAPTKLYETTPFDPTTPSTLVASPDRPDAPNVAAQNAAAALYNAGFRGDELLQATALAGAASNYDPKFQGPRGDGQTGYGLFAMTADQIKSAKLTTQDISDPGKAAKAAFDLTEPSQAPADPAAVRRTNGFNWSCAAFNDGACGKNSAADTQAPYQKFMNGPDLVHSANEALSDMTVGEPGDCGSSDAGAGAAPSGGKAGGTAATLNPMQITNAQAIIGVGKGKGIPQYGILIALATALDESTLIALPYGDTAGPDSRGLFQQRDGWGPLAVRMDPAGSAGLFYDALLKKSGWEHMTVTQAAHAVQINQDPNVYTKFVPEAQAILDKYGDAPAVTVSGAKYSGPGAAADASCAAGGTGGYMNPFQGGKWSIGRTDQGVDPLPLVEEPVKAIGDGVVTFSQTNVGWPGGAFIAYRLKTGQFAGKHIFVAEHLKDLAPVGTELIAGQTIAIALPGSPYTEWGWSDQSGKSSTALAYSVYTEGHATEAGQDFARFLHSLGAPWPHSSCGKEQNWGDGPMYPASPPGAPGPPEC